MRRDATRVTGSARLARRLLGEEALARAAAGERVWRRSDVLAWTAWLKRMHGDALATGVFGPHEAAVLLSPAQTEALWQRVIESDSAESGLLQPAVAARHAAAAHALCLAWRIDRGALHDGRHHADVAAFLRWSVELERRLDRHGWLTSTQLPDLIPVWAERVPGLVPRALTFAGFEQLTPQQHALSERLTALGVDVRVIEGSDAGAAAARADDTQRRVRRAACADPDGEMSAAAQWARRTLLARSDARIAIVVRDLADRRAALARHLDVALDPPALASPSVRPRRPWNIALGWRLPDEPLAHDALLILRAAAGRIDFSGLSRLLRSPFLAAAESERAARTRLELQLRKRREAEIPLRLIARLAQDPEHDPDAPAEFGARIERLLDLAAGGAQRRTTAAWTEHFVELLRTVGWPGERGLDSREHQAFLAWQELLTEFGALDLVLAPVDRATALTRLRRLAGDRVYQPQAAAAPVQVLGMLDALGQSFDALWIMGLDDEHWPAAPRPNPFLPVELQRRFGLPHASAARELEHAQRVTADLMAAAPDVIISWPRRDEDRNLRPSPLIANLPEIEPPGTAASARVAMLASARFETLVDERGPVLTADGRARGGTALFRDQSQCPFRAFAVHRLRATRLDSPTNGLDALDRGSLVHELLHAFWRRLNSRAALERLDEPARTALVGELVDAAVATAARQRPAVFTQRYADVERQRLLRLLHTWLEQELAREDFRVVDLEHGATIAIATGARQLTVRGRIDRVDALPDGRRILIDYKTGRSTPGQWLGARPEEPQMPLYAGLHGDRLAGVVYAQLRAGECAWQGVTREDTSLPGVKSVHEWKQAEGRDFQQLRRDWRGVIERLAAEFLDGMAAVDPLPRACTWCHLASLCRVDELRGGFARNTEASDAGEDGVADER
jgi:ATP-dependent helicase/nuclease subunit B